MDAKNHRGLKTTPTLPGGLESVERFRRSSQTCVQAITYAVSVSAIFNGESVDAVDIGCRPLNWLAAFFWLATYTLCRRGFSSSLCHRTHNVHRKHRALILTSERKLFVCTRTRVYTCFEFARNVFNLPCVRYAPLFLLQCECDDTSMNGNKGGKMCEVR